MDPGAPQYRIRIRNRIESPGHSKRARSHVQNRSLCYHSCQKVWVGGLTDEVTWRNLQELADTVGKSKWVQILGKGQGCVCYGTAEEAQTAIGSLTSIAPSLHFDGWNTKEKA